MSCQSHVNRNIVSIAADVATDNDAAVEVLNLHGNCIRSMDGLQRFTNLKELSLSSNWINCPSFAALRGLVHLTVLNLSANRITTTIGFPVLPSLCELSLAYNSLTVLDGLLDPLKFPALEILDLRDNQIADVSALSPLFYLQTMRALRLQSISKSQSNPVCAAEGYPSMLLDRMSTLETLDGEHVSVLKELAALVMPKYTSVARTFRQPPTLESAPPTPRRRQSIEPDWTVLDARLRLLEAHQTHEEPFMDDIDSQIHQATSSLRSMHKQTLETRVPPPPMSVFVETKQRRGYHVHTPPPHERDSDDGDVILETDPSVLAAPAETCHVEHVTMTTDTSSQCDVITTLTRGVQCDDETERVLRRELKAAIDRAKRAESKAVELTVDKANTSMDHDSLSKELAQVRHTVATLKQQAAADRDKLTVQMNECDQTKALLDESERRVESLQMQMKLKDDKCKNECKRALMEVEHEAEVRAREAAATAQAKHDESASQIRQIKADMQELKYTLEDAYAKYAAKEKEVGVDAATRCVLERVGLGQCRISAQGRAGTAGKSVQGAGRAGAAAVQTDTARSGDGVSPQAIRVDLEAQATHAGVSRSSSGSQTVGREIPSRASGRSSLERSRPGTLVPAARSGQAPRSPSRVVPPQHSRVSGHDRRAGSGARS
ncbi:hypothetical protein, variant 2 [Aphanomyces astaci]|uniref:U2A'/phosphoprotein 32 family A C-terminal domain-containing protein n=1 Tax=Aphanomyces astaci TaxID=112090 RepID=W4HDP1_APHAT|nr:hypothetical protein, variant 2 [Aphanomyces astaci]ETV89706.1 hypothetical protein, variant 2 [Aphanomyces astaci]|eukprot:XP_009822106.1 hypothetical protein, variant 2 [Aphanomyces astaci]